MTHAAADLLLKHLRSALDPACHEEGDDGQLLTRWVLHRNADAFSALVRRHGPMVWQVSRGILHQTQDAEDVFQATFLVLARKAAALQERSSIAGWLYQTAHRLALKTRTATARRLRRETGVTSPISGDPLEEISVREAQSILAAELHHLPAAYREPLLLCFYEGSTQDEAARRLGCSIRTLKRRIGQARALLRRRLARRGLDLACVLPLVMISRWHVPARLLQQTVSDAGRFAAKQGLTGAAAVLAEGLLRTMVLKKLAVLFAVLVTLGGMTAAVGVTSPVPAPAAQAGAKQGPADPKENEEIAPRLDRYGDPLPPGAVQRIGSSRFRQSGHISHLLYAPDGASIASASDDGSLRLWDAKTGKLRWRFPLPPRSFHRALAMSPDGKTLAVLSRYEYALVDTTTGSSLIGHTWEKEQKDLSCLAISPDLSTLARGYWDGTVRLHDSATGQEKLQFTTGDKATALRPGALNFAKDGKTIIVAGSPLSTVAAYDVASGRVVWISKMEQAFAPRLAFSRGARFLAGSFQRQSRLLVWEFAGDKATQLIYQPFNDPICCEASPDSSLLAVGGQGREIVLFETASGKEVRRLLWHPSTLSLAFAPDGKTLASADGNGGIALWDVATGKMLPASPEPSGAFGLSFTADGKQVRCIGDSIYWWDVKTGELVRRLPNDPSWYWGRAFSPDEKLLAASLLKGDIVLVDARTGTTVRRLSGHTAMADGLSFSPDGSKLFSAGGFDPRVIIWDVPTGKSLQVLEDSARRVERIVPSPDGRWLAAAASDASARGDFDIRLWDIASKKVVHRLTPRRGSAFHIVFSADSARLVSVGGEPGRPNTQGVVQLWDVATGKEVRAFSGHQERVVCAAFSPDGRMLATGSLDKTLRLWEVESGMERRRIEGHEGYVRAVDFSSDGGLLAAASDDAPVYLWDVYAPTWSSSVTAKLRLTVDDRYWQRLADPDAGKAFQAICTLVAHPGKAFAVMQEGWQHSPRATPAQVQQWLKDLDSNQFPVRQQASTALEKFATGHEELLRQAQGQATSVETRRRLAQILERPSPERLRRMRMLEIAERIGTAAARTYLQSLVAQTDDPELSKQAAASLRRLEGR
ncbi:MAG TPA: sigma-70 family RNA polymerase sigma factor [Gemmataceae bacterium]|nr:sigma-70 family RNA polymerase sigma factor [Gemmataceae bacterium]